MPIINHFTLAVRWPWFVRSKTTNQALTGVLHSDVRMYVHEMFQNPVARTPNNSVALNTSSHLGDAWKEVDGTNHPGIYTYDLPDSLWNFSVNKIYTVQISSISDAFYTQPQIFELRNYPLNLTETVDGIWQKDLSAYASSSQAGNHVLNLPAGGDVADAVWDEDRAAHSASGTFGEGVNIVKLGASALALTNLRDSLLGSIPITVETSGFTSTTTQFEVEESLSAVDDFYKDKMIIFYSGNLAGQLRQCTTYDGTNARFTMTAATAAPNDGSLAVIV